MVTEKGKEAVTPEFTEGICQEGAAILMNGEPLTIEEIIKKLKRGADAERIVHEVWDMFYGQNYAVNGWHYNCDLEPIDSFFEENDWDLDREA